MKHFSLFLLQRGKSRKVMYEK